MAYSKIVDVDWIPYGFHFFQRLFQRFEEDVMSMFKIGRIGKCLPPSPPVVINPHTSFPFLLNQTCFAEYFSPF
jgi:hypothetical protein